jgi:predicted RNase H-like HicB family nuclease
VPPKTEKSILRQGWREVAMSGDYVVLIEQASTSSGAYCPDLPGVVAAADTFEEVVALMREAIPAHIAGLVEDGLPGPPPSRVATVLVDPAA